MFWSGSWENAKVVFAPSQGAYLLHIERDDPGFNRFLGAMESSPLVPLVLELFPSKTVSALRSFFISYPPEYGRRPILFYTIIIKKKLIYPFIFVYKKY